MVGVVWLCSYSPTFLAADRRRATMRPRTTPETPWNCQWVRMGGCSTHSVTERLIFVTLIKLFVVSVIIGK